MSRGRHDFTALPMSSPMGDEYKRQAQKQQQDSEEAFGMQEEEEEEEQQQRRQAQNGEEAQSRDVEEQGDRRVGGSYGAGGIGVGLHATFPGGDLEPVYPQQQPLSPSARARPHAEAGLAASPVRLHVGAGLEMQRMQQQQLQQTTAVAQPESFAEALEALQISQARVAQLEAQLRASEADRSFASKGMDHSHPSRPDSPPLRAPRVLLGCIEVNQPGAEGPTMSLEQYFAMPSYLILVRRLPWLIGLLLLQSFSASILHRYDDYLEEHLLFSFFIPMVVGTGGNAGNQCSVMVTRALALGMDDSQVWRVVKKETPIALVAAVLLGLLAFVRVVAEYPADVLESVAIALTLALSILISIALGIAFSYGIGLLNRCDPADGAAPLLSTISDLIGIGLLVAIATGLVPE